MITDSVSKQKGESLKGNVEAWLASWGFKDNPFKIWDADQEEQPQLSRYYIKPPFYEQLLAEPKSALVYAPRGGGKSAARIMLQSECCPASRSSAVFAVPFTDFSPFAEDFTRLKEFSLRNYLDEILREGLKQLLVAISIREIETSILQNQLGELKFWLKEFASGWETPYYVDKLLTQVSHKTSRTVMFGHVPARHELAPQRIKSTEENRILSLHQKLQLVPPSPPAGSLKSSSHIMEAFLRFALNLLSTELFPCEALYVLVDGIDEYVLTQDDPQAGANLLKPLLGSIRFLEIPGLAIKFFLPIEFRRAFDQATRVDRIPTYTISWSKDGDEFGPHSRMRALFRERLRIFSNGTIQSLSEMCVPELKHIIEIALLEEAGGVPRRLLQLANQVFVEHCREAPASESEITMGEWEHALHWFRGSAVPEVPPPEQFPTAQNAAPVARSEDVILQVDLQSGRVFVAGHELAPLPELEYRLLAYLYRRKGEVCPRDEIVRAVYLDDTGISEERLNTLVYRLRKSLAAPLPAFKTMYFIETVGRGRGFRLENAR